MYIKLIIGILIGAAIGSLIGYYGKCTSGACPLTANPVRGAFWGAALGLMFALSLANSASKMPESENITPVSSVQQFDRFVRAGKPSVVDFYSNSCPPCRTLMPLLDEIAGEYADKAGFYKVDVNQNTDLARRYGIRGVPVVIFFDDKGLETNRLVGLREKAEYAMRIELLTSNSAGENETNDD